MEEGRGVSRGRGHWEGGVSGGGGHGEGWWWWG